MALTEIYVDPSIAGNSGTGTSVDPYGDLQYALDTMTRDSTNGDRLNIKAGTAEVMAAAISLATYGTPTAAAPLVFQGYTAAANDGGIGEINNGGANVSVINSSTLDFIVFQDMKLGNTGTAQIIRLDGAISLVNCELHTSTANSAIQLASGVMARCVVHSITPAAFNSMVAVTTVIMVSCYFEGGWNLGKLVTSLGFTVASNCIFKVTHTGCLGIDTRGGIIENCSFYSSVAGASNAIYVSSSHTAIINNIFTGWSGVGGAGVFDGATGELLLLGSNAFYNNTTNVSTTFATYATLANITLTNAPFTNPGAGDFSIATAAKAELQAQGWPSSFLGISTNQHLDPGAAQIQIPTATGGLLVHPGMSGGMRG